MSLRACVQGFLRMIESGANEETILKGGKGVVATLIANDDWLPEQFARPNEERYRQYLLYADPFDRFSVVSFVWGPGQRTPLHDHLTWGIVGVLRGRIRETKYAKRTDGGYEEIGSGTLDAGGITTVSPAIGDVHVVSDDLPDEESVSIHVYGSNIGWSERHVFEAATGKEGTFVSGYDNVILPRL